MIIITPHIVDIKNQADLEKLREKADNWQNNGSTEMKMKLDGPDEKTDNQ